MADERKNSITVKQKNQKRIKPEGMGGFCFVSILKKFFSARSLFKSTHVEEERGAEVTMGIGKA